MRNLGRMESKMVTIERYQDLDQARRDKESLDERGFRAVLVDESNGHEVEDRPSGSEFDGVVVLQVPEGEAQEAFEYLSASIDDEYDAEEQEDQK